MWPTITALLCPPESVATYRNGSGRALCVRAPSSNWRPTPVGFPMTASGIFHFVPIHTPLICCRSGYDVNPLAVPGHAVSALRPRVRTMRNGVRALRGERRRLDNFLRARDRSGAAGVVADPRAYGGVFPGDQRVQGGRELGAVGGDT